jgi:hypothetical protein
MHYSVEAALKSIKHEKHDAQKVLTYADVC